MTSDTTVQGGCNCGSIRYTIPAKPLTVVACHCRNCQRQSGSAYSVNLIVKAKDMSVEGELALYTDNDTNSGNPVLRKFCGKCGSPIRSEAGSAPGIYVVKAGTLDDPAPYEPRAQLWTCTALPWVTIPEEQPKFEKEPEA